MENKIFIIAPLPPPKGGIAVLAEILNKNIPSTFIFDSKIPGFLRNNPYGIDQSIFKRDGLKLPLQIIFLIYNFFQFVFNVLLLKVNVVHIISSTGPGLYRNFIFGILTKVLNRKLVFHLVGDIETHTKNNTKLHNYFIFWLLRCFDPLIVQSETHSQFLEKFDIKSDIVRNPSKFEDFRNHTNLHSSDIRKVLTVGVFGERKGFYRILKFIQENKSTLRSKGLHFVFAGNGDDESNLISYIDQLNIGEFISLYSNPKDDLIFDLYKQSYCFLLPTSKDGMPLVLIDALFFGIPIVSNNVGCIQDIIVDRRLLSNTIIEWERAFMNFLNLDDSEHKSICEKNLKLYRENFSKMKFISSISRYYEA